jgi:gamma-glutamyltranspeptidase/glutathione hydrolase
VQAVHDTIEAERHAYADRNVYLGDPDFVDNPVPVLLSARYAAAIRSGIDPVRAGHGGRMAAAAMDRSR